MINSADLLAPLLSRTILTSSEREAFAASASPPHRATKGQSIVSQSATTEALTVLCSGVAMAARMLSDGKQQIVAIFVPGDIVDGNAVPLRCAHAGVGALTAASYVQIAYSALEDLIARYPAIARALWRETAIHAILQQEWLTFVGRRLAYQRVAHFLCELSWRFEASGYASRDPGSFPLTQTELADALGLSPVHINRVLQRLRSEGLITLAQGRLTIGDRAALYKVADFDPGYLEFLYRHLQKA